MHFCCLVLFCSATLSLILNSHCLPARSLRRYKDLLWLRLLLLQLNALRLLLALLLLLLALLWLLPRARLRGLARYDALGLDGGGLDHQGLRLGSWKSMGRLVNI